MPDDWDVASTKDAWGVQAQKPMGYWDKFRLLESQIQESPAQKREREKTQKFFHDVGEGASKLFSPSSTMQQRAGGLHEAFSAGVESLGPPIAAMFGPMAPLATAGAIAAGYAGQKGAELAGGILESKYGVPHEYTQVVADAVSLYTGKKGADLGAYLQTPGARKLITPEWWRKVAENYKQYRASQQQKAPQGPPAQPGPVKQAAAQAREKLSKLPPPKPREIPPPIQKPFELTAPKGTVPGRPVPEQGKLELGDNKAYGTQPEAPQPAVAGGPGGELPASSEGPPVVQKRPTGSPEVQQVANAYNAQQGLPPVNHSQYHPLDEDFGRRVADVYETLKDDNSADPRVRAAYEALMRETKAQYNHLIQSGYKLEPWTKPGQPYKSSHEMVADLRDNKHLYFYTGGEPHPLMDKVDPETGLTYTDLFRAIHDVYGHAAAGHGFGPRGEEGAHDIHSQSFSPLARQAMTTETRGQNSWVNFGRHNYDAEGNALHIPATEKPYAQQKVDLLPEELQQRAGERYAQPAPEGARAEKLKETLPPPSTEEVDVGTNRKNLNRHLNATPEMKERSRAIAQEKFGKSRGDLTSGQLQEIWEDLNPGKKWDARHPDRNKGLEERAADRIAKQAGATPETSGEGSLLDQAQSFLKRLGDESNERMRRPGHILDPNSLKMNVPVDDFKDMAVWGAARIAQGAVTFAKFSKQMLEDAGPAAEKIRPQLQKLWAEAQKVHDRMMERFVDTKLTSTTKLLKLYREGEAGKNWYKYTRAELEQYFGEDTGLFVDMLAATSPNTSVAANVVMALKAYQQYRTGQPFTGFMPAVIGNLDRLARYGEPPSGMKVSNFKANLFGNTEAVTVDRWMMRALGWPLKSIKDRQYQFFDAYLTQVAKKAGVEPRQLQAAIWKAIKESEQVQDQTSEAFEDVLRKKIAANPTLRGLLAEIQKRRAPQ